MPPRRDIFVDNTVAKNFCNPADPELRDFMEWLFVTGSLVVSNKILCEYYGGCQDARSTTNIAALVDRQLRDGRLVKFSNMELREIKFSKARERKLRCNKKDRDHLRLVLLSHRRLAVTNDNNLLWDINHFPRVHARAARRPQDLPYRTD